MRRGSQIQIQKIWQEQELQVKGQVKGQEVDATITKYVGAEIGEVHKDVMQIKGEQEGAQRN